MNNIMYGHTRMYNAIHQSHVLVNVRFSLINTFARMQYSATLKGSSFAQSLTCGLGLGTQTRAPTVCEDTDFCFQYKSDVISRDSADQSVWSVEIFFSLHF